MSVAEAFNRLAPQYDELWTESAAGRMQREAVWREMLPLFRPGERVLDLGCGTGADAAYLASAGLRIHAIDIAPGMVEIARQRENAHRITAGVLAIEDLGRLIPSDKFDGALANFGVVNCVHDLRALAENLARLVRPGGRLLLCPLGRFCLWETAWYLLRARPGKAFRRLSSGGVETSLGFRVFYPSVAEIAAAFAPHFRLLRFQAIGVFVPPSYVKVAPRGLAVLDRLFAGWPFFRSLGDHRLLVLVRTRA